MSRGHHRNPKELRTKREILQVMVKKKPPEACTSSRRPYDSFFSSSGAPLSDHRLPARAVRRHIADYMEVNATAASAKNSMVQDKSARGAVQGRLTTAIPLDSTGSDGESVVRFRGLEQ